MDDLNRLTRAREGSWVTGSLSSFTRDEQWTLSRTGNWASRLLDLNGDGDSSDADEFTDAGTFNRANELTQRALSGGVSATYSPSYDEVGNLVNDGKDYTYEYDGFGRLVRARNRSTSALVAEYTCNGLGFRTSWKYDANASGTVDGSDPVYWFTHDDRWRIVGTYRGSDADPREVFVWHAAGLDGGGGSSYIDSVVLRQDDSSTAWTAEPDVLGRRVYPLQNWRADVVAVHDGGMIAERIKYSAYVVPFCVSAADFDADGDVDSADNSAFYSAQGAEDPSADLNLDGVVDFNDILVWIGVHNAGETGGRSVLSRASIRNRIGYAGYQHDPSITGSAQASGQSKYHVRHRVYDASIGRWTRRDSLGYVDGMSVYEYVASRPMVSADQRGLSRTPCVGGEAACGGLAAQPGRVVTPCLDCPDGRGTQRMQPTSPCDACCTEACNRNSDASGLTVCCGGTPTACYCEQNDRAYLQILTQGAFRLPDCIAAAQAACVRKHEDLHRSEIDCSRNRRCELNDRPPSHPDAPWGECTYWCGECWASHDTVKCVGAIDCAQCGPAVHPGDCEFVKRRLVKAAEERRDDHCEQCYRCLFSQLPGGPPWVPDGGR